MTTEKIPLVIRNEYLLHGRRVHVERPALRRCLAWRVGAEIARRHPGKIRLLETHPLGGAYDVLAVYFRDEDADATPDGEWRSVLSMNTYQPGATLTHESWFGQAAESDRFTWLEVLLCPDLRTDIIEPIEQAEGLGSPTATPATTSATIGPRLLATFSERTAFVRKPWRLVNGVRDSSGYDEGIRAALFDDLPGLAEHRKIRRNDDIIGIPEYRFWFAVEGDLDEHGPARLAVDTVHGTVFTTSGPADLMALYDQHGHQIDAVANAVCAPVN